MEYPCTVCTKLCFMGVDCSLCFMVNRKQGVDIPFAAVTVQRSNGHIVIIP